MLQTPYSYESVLATSERVGFRLDDVLSEQSELDFSLPFLPESLARTEELTFLTPPERLALNHIRAHGYLSLFGLIEEFILPFVLDHARGGLGAGDPRTRALLQFASEEAKHIALFKRFGAAFSRGFGTPCETVGPASAVADKVLSHAPLGVSLAILQIEWMTQRHYLETVERNQRLDPLFRSLLKHHFIEECQHAKLDALVTLELAARLSGPELEQGVEDYFAILAAFDQLLSAQVELDLASLERALSRKLEPAQQENFRAAQRRACHFTYLGSGMSHPSFVATMQQISPRSLERLRLLSDRYQ